MHSPEAPILKFMPHFCDDSFVGGYPEELSYSDSRHCGLNAFGCQIAKEIKQTNEMNHLRNDKLNH
jgi:hypothetical protein